MSKLNIYENKWNDLVFENRNKEYGAYQLRQENPRTTVNALFMGLLLITALGSIPVLISKFKPQTVEPVTEVPTFDDEHIVTPYNPTVTPPPPAPPAPVVEQTAATKTESTQLVNPVITTAENAVEKIAVLVCGNNCFLRIKIRIVYFSFFKDRKLSVTFDDFC